MNRNKNLQKTLCAVSIISCLSLRAVAAPISIAGVPIVTNQDATAHFIPNKRQHPIEQVSMRVADRSQNGNTHELTRVFRTKDSILTLPASQVIEVSPGINQWNPQTQTWQPVAPSVAITPAGAEGRFESYTARLAANCNQYGAVELEFPNGQKIASHALAIYYFDAKTGQSVLLAKLKDSAGTVVGANQVIYANAFDAVSADLVYRLSPSAFEQDLVFRKAAPPDPSIYGLNADTTFLQIVTEFVGQSESLVRAQDIKPQALEVALNPPLIIDQDIELGPMRLTLGKSFAVGLKSSANQNGGSDPLVVKSWQKIDGRNLLIESLPYSQAKSLLQRLSASSPHSTNYYASATRVLPKLSPSAQSTAAMALAKSIPADPGVVLDYVLVPNSCSGTFVFQSGVTYLINTNVTLQCDVTFQTNAVIKFARGAHLTVSGHVTCPTSGPRCILTAIDDDTAGEKISTAPAVGRYASIALTIYAYLGPQYLNNLDVRYAQMAFQFYTASSVSMSNVNVIQSDTAVGAYYTAVSVSGGSWCDVATNFYDYGSSSFSGGPTTNLVGMTDDDQDLLTNLDELTRRKTDPLNAYSKSTAKKDGEYMLMGGQGGNDSLAKLELTRIVYYPSGNYSEFDLRVSNAPLDKWYDIFFEDHLDPDAWVLVRSGPPDSGFGTSVQNYIVYLFGPPPPNGFFQAFISEDSDYDGIADGYEIAVLKTSVGNPDSDSTRDANHDGQPDYPGLGNNGIVDGDEDFDGDGLSNSYELRIGTNPLIAQNSSIDSDGDGLPDWVEQLITFYTNDQNPTPTGDSDGDGVDNYTEWSTRTDPSYGPDAVFLDYSTLPDYQRVISLTGLQVPNSQGGGFAPASSVPDEAYLDLSMGDVYGSAAYLTVFKDRTEDGTSTPGMDSFGWGVAFESPPQPPVLENAPAPDPGDGPLEWSELLVRATHIFAQVWEEAEVTDKIKTLTQNSLVYLQYRSTYRIWLEYRQLQLIQVAEQMPQGVLLRVRTALAKIHTEATILREVTFELGARFPGHDAFARFGRFVTVAGHFAQCVSVFNTARDQVWPLFKQYVIDVRNHCDSGESAGLLAYALTQLIDEFKVGAQYCPYDPCYFILWNALSNYDGYGATPCP